MKLRNLFLLCVNDHRKVNTRMTGVSCLGHTSQHIDYVYLSTLACICFARCGLLNLIFSGAPIFEQAPSSPVVIRRLRWRVLSLPYVIA